jgi:hypothetical protein
MRAWPVADPRIKVYRYEDISETNLQCFRTCFPFTNAHAERTLGTFLANYFFAKKRLENSTYQNARASQWKEHFTRGQRLFELRFGDILDRYGYAELSR